MVGPLLQHLPLQLQRMAVRIAGGDAGATMVEDTLPLGTTGILQEGRNGVAPSVVTEIGRCAALDQSALERPPIEGRAASLGFMHWQPREHAIQVLGILRQTLDDALRQRRQRGQVDPFLGAGLCAPW